MQCPSKSVAYRPRPRRSGFTLVELLVVIAIIALLAGLLFPVIKEARRKGLRTQCESNLRQLSLCLFMHRQDYEDENTKWLSTLYPDYINDDLFFVCKADQSQGRDGSKPNLEPGEVSAKYGGTIGDQYPETDDNNYRVDGDDTHRERNDEVEFCSYMYEFNNAQCSWFPSPGFFPGVGVADVDTDEDGIASWDEVKLWQLTRGDNSTVSQGRPYQPEKFPIVRCFHHYFDKSWGGIPNSTGAGTHREGLTLNAAYAGNVFRAPLTWEYTP